MTLLRLKQNNSSACEALCVCVLDCVSASQSVSQSLAFQSGINRHEGLERARARADVCLSHVSIIYLLYLLLYTCSIWFYICILFYFLNAQIKRMEPNLLFHFKYDINVQFKKLSLSKSFTCASSLTHIMRLSLYLFTHFSLPPLHFSAGVSPPSLFPSHAPERSPSPNC